MGYKSLLKKIARFILVSQPSNHVEVKLGQIRYGNLLEGKNIVITGGSRGLGFAMAKKFVSEGASVLIVGRNEDTLIKAKNAIGGGNCKYISYNTDDVYNADSFMNECWKLLGGVDVFVSNAGISFHEGNFKNVTIDGFDRQFNTNFRSYYFLSKSFLEHKLKEGTQGCLLLMSSETSFKNIDIPYGMTKAAINSLTGALARRVYKNGIRVNALAPGVTLTDMTKDYAIAQEGNLANNGPAGRVFVPEEVAEVACFIICDAAKCINGEVIACDAGGHLNVNM